ncbi:CLUMA_CG001604, isoform A [Clunio marinus]|uniref:CLUMA_CG001604, isoform A n=1 Tax=Clunio marinus TaxID=568069 RepID=A0A1J1HID8_9DIPT|nr:CLUMA_CG001604, isoform A [Clunio marinus]
MAKAGLKITVSSAELNDIMVMDTCPMTFYPPGPVNKNTKAETVNEYMGKFITTVLTRTAPWQNFKVGEDITFDVKECSSKSSPDSTVPTFSGESSSGFNDHQQKKSRQNMKETAEEVLLIPDSTVPTASGKPSSGFDSTKFMELLQERLQDILNCNNSRSLHLTEANKRAFWVKNLPSVGNQIKTMFCQEALNLQGDYYFPASSESEESAALGEFDETAAPGESNEPPTPGEYFLPQTPDVSFLAPTPIESALRPTPRKTKVFTPVPRKIFVLPPTPDDVAPKRVLPPKRVLRPRN